MKVKINAATKLKQILNPAAPELDAPLTHAERAALKEGRLGGLVAEHGSLGQLLQNVPEKQIIEDNSNHHFSKKPVASIKKYLLFLFFFVSNLLPFSLSAQFNPKNVQTEIKTYKYTFTPQDNFNVSYADYPKGQEHFYELQFKKGALLPSEIKPNTYGLKISGNNHSDDLFMYAYTQLAGLKAKTRYKVNFSLEFASNAPIDSIGVGGSPGASVYVKIGAVNKKPGRYLDESGNYRMILDKGNQGIDGKEMILIGTIGVDTHDSLYRLKTLPYQPDAEMQAKLDGYTVTSNEKGEVWLIFGSDSGYESTSTLFYTNLVASFKELK